MRGSTRGPEGFIVGIVGTIVRTRRGTEMQRWSEGVSVGEAWVVALLLAGATIGCEGNLFRDVEPLGDAAGPVDAAGAADARDATETCVPESDPEMCRRLGRECGEVVAEDNCGVERSVECGECEGCRSCSEGLCVDDDAKCAGCRGCAGGSCVDDDSHCEGCAVCSGGDCEDDDTRCASGVCIDRQCVECRSDEECDGCESCSDDGQCVEDDSNCSGCNSCTDGTCVEDDANCGECGICAEGACQDDSSLCGGCGQCTDGECRDDDSLCDTDACQVCEGQVCVDACSGCQTCDGDGNCTDDDLECDVVAGCEECRDGRCVSRCDGCLACRQGACEPSDRLCGLGQCCPDGNCSAFGSC